MIRNHPHTADKSVAKTRQDAESCASARERLLANLPVTQRRLRLSGISTTILEGGEGAPIVLLHGPGEYAAKWLRVIPDLVRTHRVIAPDLPGHGDSDPIQGGLDVQRIVAWLDDLIQCTCGTPPVLVGQIMSGAIAAHFAAGSSKHLSSLVLVDALGLAPFQPEPEFGQALMEYMGRPAEDTHDGLWNRCAFDLDSMRNRMGRQWDDLREYNLDRAKAATLRATQHALMEQFGFPAIPSTVLERIAVPTVLIWGRHDLATPLAVARAAAARYGWPLVVIENAGDDPPMEQPAAFLETLRTAFYDMIPSGSDETETSTRAAWDQIAPGYDRTNTPTQMTIASEGLRRAGLRPTMTFLDVASGSGAMSIPAARLGARVTAIDQSAVMLDLLAARAREEKLSIETRVMDGHALEFDDNSFQMAGSQFGVMLFPDMPQAIREMVRVTTPGGRVLIHAYGDPHRIEFLGFLVTAVQSVRPDFGGPPMNPPPLEFQLADPDRLRNELFAAGLTEVRVETIVESTVHGTGKDLWEWLTCSNPIVEAVLGMLALSEHERSVIQQRLEKLVVERAGGASGAVLTNPVNIGVGTKRSRKR